MLLPVKARYLFHSEIVSLYFGMQFNFQTFYTIKQELLILHDSLFYKTFILTPLCITVSLK